MRPVLPCALALLIACGSGEEAPASEPVPPIVEPEGSSEAPVEVALAADADEPPPPPPPEPETSPPVAQPTAPLAAAIPGTAARLDLSSAWIAGAEVRRQIRWSSTSDVVVSHNGRELRSSIVASVDAVVHVTVTAADKGAAQTMEVRFESVERETSGAPAELAADPEPGTVWSCRVDTEPLLCAMSPELTQAPPDWLALSFAPLLPARAVEPGEVWSRRAGVSASLGAGGDGTLRATVQAEAAYETADGLFSTARFEIGGEDVSHAFGRSTALELTGEGAFEFDLRSRRVIALDARWTGETSGVRNNGASHSRVTETTIRVTELDTVAP